MTVTLRGTAKYEAIPEKAGVLAVAGASTETIGRLLGTTWQTAHNAVKFATSGGTVPAPGFRPKATVAAKTDDATAAEIVRLREQENWPFARIATQLGIAHGTAVRAYDRLRPAAVQAAGTGKQPSRGRYRHLDRKVLAEVESMLRAGRRGKRSRRPPAAD